MENDSKTGRTLIIVAGYVAGGKTTFSHKLSDGLNLPVFNKDSIKAILGSYTAIHSREESKKASRATFGILSHIAENLMKTGCSFILESNFISKEAIILQELIRKYSYNSLTFVFYGDLKVLHKRFVERDNSSEREPANRIGGLFDDFSAFEPAIRSLGDFNIGDRIIRIDTTSFELVDFNKYIMDAKDFLASPNETSI